jgi:TusA-related sulfurtransferase
LTRPAPPPDRRALEDKRAAADLVPARTVDALGLYCPMPIIRTAEAIMGMRAGEVLEVLSDDRVVLIDMPAWCLSTRHEYLGFREDGPGWRLYVRKG